MNQKELEDLAALIDNEPHKPGCDFCWTKCFLAQNVHTNAYHKLASRVETLAHLKSRLANPDSCTDVDLLTKMLNLLEEGNAETSVLAEMGGSVMQDVQGINEANSTPQNEVEF